MRMFITYEEPFQGRTFTEDQMKELYHDLADKNEYPDYIIWFTDMLRSRVFEEIYLKNYMKKQEVLR